MEDKILNIAKAIVFLAIAVFLVGIVGYAWTQYTAFALMIVSSMGTIFLILIGLVLYLEC